MPKMPAECLYWMSPDEEIEAIKYGQMREDLAIRRGQQPTYGLKVQFGTTESLDMHIHGCLTESACRGWLSPEVGVKWHAYTEEGRKGLPDLDDFIDVKGARKDHHGLLIEGEPLIADWAYVLVSSEHRPRFRVMGWVWGHEVLELSEPIPGSKRPHVRVRPWHLPHHPRELVHVIRSRRGSRSGHRINSV